MEGEATVKTEAGIVSDDGLAKVIAEARARVDAPIPPCDDCGKDWCGVSCGRFAQIDEIKRERMRQEGARVLEIASDAANALFPEEEVDAASVTEDLQYALSLCHSSNPDEYPHLLQVDIPTVLQKAIKKAAVIEDKAWRYDEASN